MNLEAEIAKNEEALAKATSIREKELAEFNAEEKDMLQSIGALKSAIVVLSKHHSSFAQVGSEDLLNIAVTLKFQLYKHSDMLRGIITPSQKKAVAAFVQAPAAYEDLKAAKLAEIAAGNEQKDTKTQELADTDSALAQAKQDLEDTRNSLSADQKFLINLKETCQMTDAEW